MVNVMMLRDKLYVPSVMVKYKCSKFYLRSVLFSEVSHLSCSCFLSLVAMVNTRGACVEGTTKEDSHILLFTSAFMLFFLLSMWPQSFFPRCFIPCFFAFLFPAWYAAVRTFSAYEQGSERSPVDSCFCAASCSPALPSSCSCCCCCCCCPQFPGCCLQLQRPSHVTCAPSHPNLYWLFKTIIDKSSTSFREEA